MSLKYNTCLGACSQGPVVSVDHKIMGPQSMSGGANMPQDVSRMISDLRNGS